MKQIKRRIFAGALCEQIVRNVPDNVHCSENYDPERRKKERFEDAAAYDKFKLEISRRNHNRLFHANFSPTSLYSTLTFADEYEVHTFPEAKQVRSRFVRALKRVYPDAVIFLYMGRGKATNRIHFHMVSEGVPEAFIRKKWKYGTIVRIEHLRERCYYDGIDHGQDYTGLANYLFNHWTEEVGGHHWMQTKNTKKPDKEEPTEVKIRGGYSTKRTPPSPKGYKLVEAKATQYGYYYFKYVAIGEPRKRSRKTPPKNTGSETG